jgi:hypothetical protein
MTSVVTQWSILDLDLLYTKINTAAGSTIVTNFGRLDPTLAEKQINAWHGSPEVFRENGPLSKGVTDPGWSPPALGTALGI